MMPEEAFYHTSRRQRNLSHALSADPAARRAGLERNVGPKNNRPACQFAEAGPTQSLSSLINQFLLFTNHRCIAAFAGGPVVTAAPGFDSSTDLAARRAPVFAYLLVRFYIRTWHPRLSTTATATPWIPFQTLPCAMPVRPPPAHSPVLE